MTEATKRAFKTGDRVEFSTMSRWGTKGPFRGVVRGYEARNKSGEFLVVLADQDEKEYWPRPSKATLVKA